MIHLIVAVRKQKITMQNVQADPRADARFFAARQLTNFKYGNLHIRIKAAEINAGAGARLLK